MSAVLSKVTNEPKVITSTITPAQAEAWLARNTRNRKVRPAHVRRLASAMGNGEWRLNGETIKFAADGTLLDGQHRLMAVVASGRSVPMMVADGLPAAVVTTIDTGKKRTTGDAFEMRGIPYYRFAASTARFGLAIDAAIAGTDLHYAYISATNAAVVEYYDARPELQNFVEFVTPRFMWGVAPTILIASLWAIYSRQSNAHPFLEDFLPSLEKGANLADRSPVLALRSLYLENRRKVDRNTMIPMTIKAWNVWVQGGVVEQLRFQKREAFPQVLSK